MLDLGGRSGDWLIAHRAAGFMPRRAVLGALQSEALHVVEGTPTFPFPAYACWNRELEPALIAEIIVALKEQVGSL